MMTRGQANWAIVGMFNGSYLAGGGRGRVRTDRARGRGTCVVCFSKFETEHGITCVGRRLTPPMQHACTGLAWPVRVRHKFYAMSVHVHVGSALCV